MRGLSYASGTSEVPLLGETIGANLERTVAAFPDNEAMVDVPSARRWTYRQLDGDVDTLARALLARGIERGDRVGIWSPNCAEWVLVQYATAKIGAILVNVNPAYRSHELTFALNQSGIGLLFVASADQRSDYPTMVGEVESQCPRLTGTVVIGTDDWASLLAVADEVDEVAVGERAAELSFDDPINIQYTSGTTGYPKGALLSHHNILNNGYFVGELLGYTDRDRICLPVPFYHCFGMVMGNLGATSTAPASSFRLRRSTRAPRSKPSQPNAAPRSMACRRCSSPSSATKVWARSICRHCAPGSWPDRPARWKS